MSNYYTRTSAPNTDQTPTFATDKDRQNEAQVIAAIESKWRCKVHPFGKLCQVDFYALRDNRIVSVLELKSRTHERARYPDVFLNVRKWLALTLASMGMGCPAIFVVKFTDGIWFVPVNEIPAGTVEMGGTARIVKSRSDIEPVFRVDVGLLKAL